MENKNLSIDFKQKILNNLDEINSQLVEKEAGVVHSVEDSIIKVEGLTKVGFDEAVIIDGKFVGFVAGMEGDIIKVVLLDKTSDIQVGDEVKRTSQYL